MTAAAIVRKTYSLEAYFALEDKSVMKHEYDNGKLMEMAGGTIDHGLICSNIITLLNLLFSKKGNNPYYVFGSDVKLWLPNGNKVFYPDAIALVTPIELYPGRRDVLMNPLLIVEVLSDSTAAYDRGKKFESYCSIPSFREYVLVSQNEPSAEAYYLHDPKSDLWKISRASGLDSTLFLHSIGIEIALQDLYRGLTFEEIAAESL